MRCWQCGAIPNVAVPMDEPVRVICTCGKDLGLLHPKPKAAAPPKPAAAPVVDVAASDTLNNRRVVHAGGYLGGVCVALLGALFLAGGGYAFWQSDDALATMKKTEGRIVKLQRSDGGRSRSLDAIIQFDAADGKSYLTGFVMPSSTKVGNRVSILYDPSDPTVNRQASFNSLYGFAWAGSGLGFVILVAGLFSIYRHIGDNEKFRAEMAEDEARHGSRFPPVCAGCAHGAPAGTFRVCGPTKVKQGPAATVLTTPFVEVPICRKCLWSIYAIYAAITLIGFAVGGGVFCAIFMQEGDVKTLGIGATLAGVLAGAIAAGITQFCTRSRVTLGHLDPEKNEVHFKNAAYQQLYHEHVVKTVAGNAKVAGALESLLGK